MSVSYGAAWNRLVEAPPLTRAPSFQNLLSSRFADSRWGTRFNWVAQAQPRCERGVIVCATKSGRNKAAKKKSGKGDKGGRDFDRLMLVWDDAFEQCCETPSRAELLRSIAKEGLERCGRGCVLVSATVQTLARGSGSGFTNKFRPDSDDTPAFTTLDWIAEYVPRALIEDPTAFDNQTSITSGSQVEPGVEEFPLVKPANWLAAVKRMMDRTRLLGLTSEGGPGSLVAEDAGGEAPYDAEADQFVLVLFVLIDGSPTVGADVVSVVGLGEGNWKLTVRDLAIM